MHLPGGFELILVLLVVMLMFGAAKLPKLARSMGQSAQEFKAGLKEGGQDESDTECRSCGQELLPDAKFCPACGAEAHVAA